jgi:hypothetical protein
MPFISQDAINKLESLRKGYTNLFSVRGQLRKRFETIDKYVAREVDQTETGAKATAVNRNGDRTKIPNQEIPICFSQMDTAHAYLVGVFCTGHPIFGVVTPRKYKDAGVMMQSLCARDQQQFGWVGNVMSSLQDAVKYNLCASEVLWHTKKVSTVKAEIKAGRRKTTQTSQVEYQGNKIKSLDIYNVIFDSTVPPHMVHEIGAYAGYFEPISYIRAKEHLSSLDSDYAIYKNVGDALSNARGVSNESYTPSIRRDGEKYQPEDWSSFWGSDSRNAKGNYSGKYELLTVYCRIIPEEYGVTNMSGSGTPSIWKLEWLNGALIYAEPMTNAHSFLPIVIGVAMPDKLGLQTKSFTENVMDLQDGTTSLMNGTLASMRRAVSDRALYDPTRINPNDVNSAVPNAKIPVKMNMWQKDLEQAYKQIPFEDRASQFFMQNFQVLMNLTETTTGMNRASQGNFQKGNKTQSEFDTVMNKSDARSQKMAMQLENCFFAPIKYIIKCNYIQYAMSEELFDMQTETDVKVDPQKLRDAIVEFSVSDGLLPSDKLANNEMLVAAINTMAQQQDLIIEYDIGGMMVDMLKNRGLDLSQYKRDQNGQQEFLQNQAARNAALSGQPAGPGGPAAGSNAPT